MPCGPQLIEAVAVHLDTQIGKTPGALRPDIGRAYFPDRCPTLRAIRYAITELIKQGRAKRDGRQGAVYAVRDPVGGAS